eukprot:CAMPEP_0184333316 /NCGR_PEP_ID=MMETSP1089-20130417/2314_1 /TAXON_ID=38269 ORGANISM="Gloeochaete wittrockiana, Strain SAG46.84" /NCGR_SAMPLE_ID=MMETSP1089 /ASSEMBLY_ACC=CAM_ASM_000445 /LENGTH=492 /DNA_ID=CAMNT_0026657061 /DNA_START=17 /DNA_END=1495 /DNA_ORIENTATION=+
MADFNFLNRTQAAVICCLCGVGMPPNPSNMCVNCLRTQVDITEGIPKQLVIHFCKGCERYLQPPNVWVRAELESRELLSILLKRIRGISKVTLSDAGFVWTEPHSKRIKVKLTIQKEVMASTILEQKFIVEFVVAGQQCTECQKSDADLNWWAVLQLRQKVSHKRTFFYLEQLILKHNLHQSCVGIKEHPDGLDFQFNNKNQAHKLLDFLTSVSPIRSKLAKELISHDIHSNTFNYKFTFSVEIPPVCRDDIVCLPKAVAQHLGNIYPVMLCSRVSNVIQLVDPTSLINVDLPADAFWHCPFRALVDRRQLIKFIILDVEPLGQYHNKYCLADATIARDSDFGKNDTQYIVRTHLGYILKPGDYAVGYDMQSANFNDDDISSLGNRSLPDIILVKKHFERTNRKRLRKWKLRNLDKEEQDNLRKGDADRMADDYEAFMQEIEEDPEMRNQINLYKAVSDDQLAAESSDAEGVPQVDISELLDDFDQMKMEDV